MKHKDNDLDPAIKLFRIIGLMLFSFIITVLLGLFL